MEDTQSIVDLAAAWLYTTTSSLPYEELLNKIVDDSESKVKVSWVPTPRTQRTKFPKGEGPYITWFQKPEPRGTA